jgi:hypothetical protein
MLEDVFVSKLGVVATVFILDSYSYSPLCSDLVVGQPALFSICIAWCCFGSPTDGKVSSCRQSTTYVQYLDGLIFSARTGACDGTDVCIKHANPLRLVIYDVRMITAVFPCSNGRLGKVKVRDSRPVDMF